MGMLYLVLNFQLLVLSVSSTHLITVLDLQIVILMEFIAKTRTSMYMFLIHVIGEKIFHTNKKTDGTNTAHVPVAVIGYASILTNNFFSVVMGDHILI